MTRREFVKRTSIAAAGTAVMPAQAYLIETLITLCILTFGGIVIIRLKMLRPRTFDLEEPDPVVPTEQIPIPVIIPCVGPNGFPGLVTTTQVTLYPSPSSFIASIKPQNMPNFSRAATYISTSIAHKDDLDSPRQTTEPIEVWVSPSYFVARWRNIAYTGNVIPDTKIWLPMLEESDRKPSQFFSTP